MFIKRDIPAGLPVFSRAGYAFSRNFERAVNQSDPAAALAGVEAPDLFLMEKAQWGHRVLPFRGKRVEPSRALIRPARSRDPEGSIPPRGVLSWR